MPQAKYTDKPLCGPMPSGRRQLCLHAGRISLISAGSGAIGAPRAIC